MKREIKKIALIASATVLITLTSCIKKVENPAIIKPGDGDVGHCNDCKHWATGTIEKCSDKWFINSNDYYSSFAPAKTEILVPGNLPHTFKVNGLTVRFKYSEQLDSTKLNCGFCGNGLEPMLYGQNIHLCSIEKDSNVIIAYKPVIYLYPEKEMTVKVELNYQGNLTVTYPDYDKAINGWEVTAQKNGTLKNKQDGMEYQYLFWEGAPTIPYNFNMKEGFCVKGTETKSFLQNILPKLGLTPKEYNEMIVFWLPKMMNNNYNIIHFAAESYTKSAPINITPKPESLIRVFMAYQSSKVYIKTSEQKIVTPKRKGFTVVEWGGTEVNEKANFNQPLF